METKITGVFSVSVSFSYAYSLLSSLPSPLSPFPSPLSPFPSLLSPLFSLLSIYLTLIAPCWLLLLQKALTGNTELLGVGNISGNFMEQKACLPFAPLRPILPLLQATPTAARRGGISAED